MKSAFNIVSVSEVKTSESGRQYILIDVATKLAAKGGVMSQETPCVVINGVRSSSTRIAFPVEAAEFIKKNNIKAIELEVF